MNIDSITNGLVIDHITSGKAMRLYELLELEKIDASVAMIMNVVSRKSGKKDIIKIDALVPVNLDIIGYVDPDATVNVIRDGKVAEKMVIEMPEKMVNIFKCKNPRCITCCEQELDQVFILTDRKNKIYRCAYCETKAGN